MVFVVGAGALVGGLAATGTFSAPKTPTPTAPPPIPPPSIMPTSDSDAVTAAAKKQALLAQMQSGRASTILSSGASGAGGGAGGADKLGG